MRILIFGARGLIGSALNSQATRSRVTSNALTRQECDLTDLTQVRAAFDSFKPDIVVHAAHMGDARECEKNPERAYLQNCKTSENVAIAANEHGASTVYISGNIIFSGSSKRYPSSHSENDLPVPIGVFASSKLAGEERVREISDRHYIIRTSWVYGKRSYPGKPSLVDHILTAGYEGLPLSMTANQWASPTLVDDLCAAMLSVVEAGVFGTYHLVNEGETTPYDFALAVLQKAKLTTVVSRPEPVKTDGAQSLVLKNVKAAQDLGIRLRPWAEALESHLMDR